MPVQPVPRGYLGHAGLNQTTFIRGAGGQRALLQCSRSALPTFEMTTPHPQRYWPGCCITKQKPRMRVLSYTVRGQGSRDSLQTNIKGGGPRLQTHPPKP